LNGDFELLEHCFVDDCRVVVKNGVGVVVFTAEVVVEPVVVNPSARLLNAVSFNLGNGCLKTGEVIVRLVIKLIVLWEMVEVDKLRNHFVRAEPVLQVLGGLGGVRAVWIVCVWLKLLAVPNQQF
jgi:hypothetical protein